MHKLRSTRASDGELHRAARGIDEHHTAGSGSRRDLNREKHAARTDASERHTHWRRLLLHGLLLLLHGLLLLLHGLLLL